MPRVEQPVVLMRSQSRGHDQNATFRLGCKFVSDAGKFNGRRVMSATKMEDPQLR